MSNKRNGTLVYALLIIAAFSFRVAVASFLANDELADGQVYSQIALNVLEQGVYSHATEPPYNPTFIRLPGYPLFLAGVYSIFGHGDTMAVRIVQALVDTASCVLIALIAFLWEPDAKRKRHTSIAALALAAFCPFTTIYVATILTETLTIFFTVAMCLTATLAFQTIRTRKALLLWAATGFLAGVAVLFRPDTALFALAIGITLVAGTLIRSSDMQLSKKREEILYRFSRASYLGATFSLAFCLVLVPWTIRNARVFKIFQPLAPAYSAMPGEFVPRGYFYWLRTWIDDNRYIGPVLWSLDASAITLKDIPNHAFDSAEEKRRVAALLERYNHPSAEQIFADPDLQESPGTSEADPEQDEGGKTQKGEDESADGTEGNQGEADSESDETYQDDQNASPDQVFTQSVEMTPEIDSSFAQIAIERKARNPLRYYVWLPFKRAFSLWSDTHSQFYPFEGALLPLSGLDPATNQVFWLPLFAVLTFIYTLLGIAGGWFLWETRELGSRQWVLLVALMTLLRLGYFSTLEHSEPRHVVELFPLLAILGGIALTRMLDQLDTYRTSRRNRAR